MVVVGVVLVSVYGLFREIRGGGLFRTLEVIVVLKGLVLIVLLETFDVMVVRVELGLRI
jgi:hypothetical protein